MCSLMLIHPKETFQESLKRRRRNRTPSRLAWLNCEKTRFCRWELERFWHAPPPPFPFSFIITRLLHDTTQQINLTTAKIGRQTAPPSPKRHKRSCSLEAGTGIEGGIRERTLETRKCLKTFSVRLQLKVKSRLTVKWLINFKYPPYLMARLRFWVGRKVSITTYFISKLSQLNKTVNTYEKYADGR